MKDAVMDSHPRPSSKQTPDKKAPDVMNDEPPPAADDARRHARDAFLRPLNPVLAEFLTLVEGQHVFGAVHRGMLDPDPNRQADGLIVDDLAQVVKLDDGSVEVSISETLYGYLGPTEHVMSYDEFERIFTQYEAICRPDGDS